MSQALLSCFQRHRYEVNSVDSGQAALAGHDDVDMVLLALELPDLDGVEVCREIRVRSNVPIIALTSGSGEVDRVLAIQEGADDCLVKPFSHRELLVRMRSIMRRMHASFGRVDEISHGSLSIDPYSRQVHVNGDSVSLTRKEFDLLYMLASRPGAVVSRKELMAQVWEDEWAVSDRTIDTHVSTLRSKLGNREWIITIHGVGYRMGAAGEPVGLTGR
jgi:DNA-binding response OmpR family regulator